MTDRAAHTPTHRHFQLEWERLRRRPDVLRRATDWHLVEGTVDDLDTLVDAVRHTVVASERERRLGRLVELGVDDALAIRVVLQVMLPELVALHRRRARQGWAHVELGDLLATGWMAIRTFNPDRRPSRMINSLVSDVDWHEYRRALRRRADLRATAPDTFDELAAAGEPTPLDELVEVLSSARQAGLADDELDLVRRIVTSDRPGDIATQLGVTERTIRNRRTRVVGRLRELAA